MKTRLILASSFLLFFVLSFVPAASALIWCEDHGGQTQITTRSVTQSTQLFEQYAECSLDSSSGIYSCADYCASGSTLAKFHCSLHQPGAVRLAKRDYVNCADAGYAGCSAGACVAKMPSGLVVTPTPSPAAESRAWCKPVAALSAAAPGEIVGARADGSTYALTDYCSDGRTLAHYSCSGVFYRVELRKCAGAGVCAAGACAAQAAVEVPGADSGYGAWMFYGVVGVFLVACGIALWVYLSGEKARLAKAEKRRGGRGGARW